MCIDLGDDAIVGVRARDTEHLGMPVENSLRIGTQATGDEHAAVVLEGFADRLQRFIDGTLDEPAGVHDHDVRGFVAGAIS